MAAIDHLIFASRDLQAGVELIHDTSGVLAAPGGPHPGVGTHNALMSFDDETYFEIIAIDPNQPDPDRARPFRLDDGLRPRLAGYAIHPSGGDTIEEIAARMRAAGFDPGPVSSMSRQHPDGHMIEWELTRGGDAGPRSDDCLPFIIDWGDTPTPAQSAPHMGDLLSLEVHHPDPAVRALAEALGLGLVVSDGPAALTARIRTASGQIELTSG